MGNVGGERTGMKLELTASTIGKEEISEVNASLCSGFVTMGAKVEIFEKQFAEYIGSYHAVMVNSGSSANLLMMKQIALLLKPGSKVLVPALSWSTTYWPVVQSGLTPVLMDIDVETLNIGHEQLDKALNAHPDAKAIIVAHIMGNPSSLCDRDKDQCPILMVEDSCETLGSTIRGQKTGKIGKIGTFSFFYSHHMTTIEGGMIVTDIIQWAEWFRVMRSHGWSRGMTQKGFHKEWESRAPDIDPRFLFIGEGYNLRPTELNAAIGIHQLAKLDSMNTARREVEKKMRAVVEPYGDLIKPIRITDGADAALFAFPVLMNDRGARNGFSRHLEANGIQTRPIVAGTLARHPAMKDVQTAGPLTNADRVANCGLYWGLHPHVTDEQLHHLEQNIKGFYSREDAA